MESKVPVKVLVVILGEFYYYIYLMKCVLYVIIYFFHMYEKVGKFISLKR
jgi:hypothetical protein